MTCKAGEMRVAGSFMSIRAERGREIIERESRFSSKRHRRTSHTATALRWSQTYSAFGKYSDTLTFPDFVTLQPCFKIDPIIVFPHQSTHNTP